MEGEDTESEHSADSDGLHSNGWIRYYDEATGNFYYVREDGIGEAQWNKPLEFIIPTDESERERQLFVNNNDNKCWRKKRKYENEKNFEKKRKKMKSSSKRTKKRKKKLEQEAKQRAIDEGENEDGIVETRKFEREGKRTTEDGGRASVEGKDAAAAN